MRIVCLLLQLYVLAVLARILLSFFPVSPGSALSSFYSALYAVTEPVLGPVRRVVPPVGLGGMGLDLSPMIVLLAIQLLLVPALC